MSNKIALEALTEIREALRVANETPNGPITDTIWMPGRPETLFDAFDAAIAALQAALQAEPQGWMPIETAPKDEATYFLATNGSGVWVAHWQPVAGSGYRFDNPWRTVMLNHWHIEDKQRRYEPPTHYQPLPTPPKD